jgi:hypothetical protein
MLPDVEKLEILEPDSKSKGFFALLDTIFDNCKTFNPNSTRRKTYEIDENQFQNATKNTLL